jgi:hypothetical protein
LWMIETFGGVCHRIVSFKSLRRELILHQELAQHKTCASALMP